MATMLTSSKHLFNSIYKCGVSYYHSSTLLTWSSSLPTVRSSFTHIHFHKQYFSSYMLKINGNALSAYAQHVQKIFDEVSFLNASSVKTYNWPPLLFDELGGKANIALKRLQEVVLIAREIQKMEEDCHDMSTLANESDVDQDFLLTIEREILEAKTEIEHLNTSFVDAIIKDKEVEQCDGAILEVRAGVGGEEAMIFAREIYEMYWRFCDMLGFDLKEVDSESDDESKLLKASCVVTSSDGFAYSLLRHEVGVHRVQRVPKTESRGRMHTSTVSVAVIPKHDVTAFELNPNDVKKQFTCSPGGGGQHVNKTMSCAIVTHVPTNTQVRCHATRNAVENLSIAMNQLKQILFKRILDEKVSRMNSIRSQQIRSRERSDKIRTYNYHHDRVTDHRNGFTTSKVNTFLSGGSQLVLLLKELDEKYRNEDKIAIMNALISEAGIK